MKRKNNECLCEGCDYAFSRLMAPMRDEKEAWETCLCKECGSFANCVAKGCDGKIAEPLHGDEEKQ
jgi:hypothetical protein